MTASAEDLIRRQIEFTEEDEGHVHALASAVEPALGVIVDRLLGRLLRDPRFSSAFTGGPAHFDRFREMLRTWVGDMVGGDYGSDYWIRRAELHRPHLHAGLAQQHMPVCLEIIRQEVDAAVRASGLAAAGRRLESFAKLLTIECVALLDSYKRVSDDHIRREERIMAEERLTRSEHLAQLGRMAASLAHEIRNPLAGISSAIEVIRDGLALNDPRRQVIREVIGQITRLDTAVKDMLDYARPSAPSLHPLDLPSAVEHMLEVIRGAPAMQHVEVVMVCSEPMPIILADAGQIEHLVMNLVFNAAHASRRGGRIEVIFWHAGDRVSMAIVDHGQGMAEDVRQRAFEPFYTTKAKGTGLGLAICKRIVEVHQGTISLESTPDVGTRVTVEFGVAPQDRATGAAAGYEV
ncbi:MAG TPA: ATP-binding protein [Phycisphaerae bacterium]|nr:ATP-binding protein [Phycisphaerae bacterium]HRY70376.1 ATP-binding protein [Phycisphaerae bacterium]HSA28093.1 ATP-binding protein [Phycisphaerae bacterium]